MNVIKVGGPAAEVDLSEPCLRLTRHKRTGAEIVVLAGVPNVAIGDDAKRLGGCYGTRSGKQADGGPGHKVPGVWFWTKRRYDADPLLRAELEYLVARNTRDFTRSERACAALKAARQEAR